jgi:two-component sensor histidine kinase
MVSQPPLTRRLRLAAEATAPRRARDFLAAACAAWRADRLIESVAVETALIETAGLVLSELVSNAVLYAGTELDVELRLSGGWLTLSVRDGGAGMPRLRNPKPGAIGGHGLDIVSRLTDSWGVSPDPTGGKTVWCALRAA